MSLKEAFIHPLLRRLYAPTTHGLFRVSMVYESGYSCNDVILRNIHIYWGLIKEYIYIYIYNRNMDLTPKKPFRNPNPLGIPQKTTHGFLDYPL